MRTLLQRGMKMAAQQVRRHGELVQYTSASETVQLRALQVKPAALVDDPQNIRRVAHEDLEWILVHADLTLRGAVGEPALGDRLTRRNPITQLDEIYEVRSEGQQQCWRRVDAAGVLIAVRTKLVSEN